MPTLFQISTFLKYWLEAVDLHSLHSPFFFDFYSKVVKQKTTTDRPLFEDLRKKLIQDHREITYQDLGAGSAHSGAPKRKISDIAKKSLTPQKFAALYDRIVQYYDSKTIVELGTSLGINTLYLSKKDDAHVTTFEGASTIAEIARITFDFAMAKNITLVEGNIDNSLPDFLQSCGKIDLAFIDANHRYEPTKRYFNWLIRKTHDHSIIILDDIHYTKEMEMAWNEIRQHAVVYSSVDLYRCGLVFFDPSLNKQHVVLQY